MALNAKQERFVAEYLIDLNQTQAAIRAGYSPRSAEVQGSRLLSNANIKQAVSEAQAKRSKRTELTQDRVVNELARLGFYDIRKAVRWGENPGGTEGENADPNGLNIYPVSLVASENVDDDTAAAITEVSLTAQGVKLKMADKRAALESLLKHLGGLPDNDAAPALNINITTAAPVKDVRVTRSDT